jgi:radical SAM protein with 4Fe4S-binding SPASM domain
MTKTIKSVVRDRFSPFKTWNHFDKIIKLSNPKHFFKVFPVTVEVDPTNFCNHRCIFCNDQKKVNRVFLKHETMLRLIDNLKECKIKSVVLKGGGEPSAYPYLAATIDELSKEGFAIGMITNGTYLHKHYKSLSKLDWIRVSVDAFSNYTYQKVHGCVNNIDRIFESMEYIAKEYPDTIVGANFVVNNYNYMEIPQLIVKLEKIGVKTLNIRPPFLFEGELKEEAWQEIDKIVNLNDSISKKVMVFSYYKYRDRDMYYTNKKWDKCRATGLIGSIGADGNVYACCALKGFKEFSFGNIKEQSFREIWSSQKRKKVISKIGGEMCKKYCSDRLDLYNCLLAYLANQENRKNLFL